MADETIEPKDKTADQLKTPTMGIPTEQSIHDDDEKQDG